MTTLHPTKDVMKSEGLCREGLYALPKTMFDIFCKAYKRRKKFFNSLILDIFQRLGHFLRKGKVVPVQGRASWRLLPKNFFTKTVSKHLFCPPKIGAKYRKFGLYPYQRRS